MVLGLVIGGLLLLGLGVVGVWSFSLYNQLVRLNRDVNEAWSNIDVLLKQRNEELPKLIDSVEEYKEYEKETFQEVVDARNKVQEASNAKEAAEADSMLQSALGNLFALAEDYPDLKANENFMQLQDRISSLEEQLSDRRELYNEAVNNWNVRQNQIPYNFIVALKNSISSDKWSEKELFEATEEEKEDINVSEEFGGDSE